MTRLGWSERPIAALANYENGYPFKPHQLADTGTPIVRIRQLNDPSAGFDHYEGDLEPKYQLSDGDLIFSWSGSLSVGFWTRGNAFLNQHLFRVDPASGVDKRWLAYALTWSVARFEGFMHGSAMTHITKPMMKAVRAPVPPVDEQRAIADYLDRETARIDTLIEEQQRLIEMLSGRRKAVVDAVVTRGVNADARLVDSGVGWVGPIPEGWSTRPLWSMFRRTKDIDHPGEEMLSVFREFGVVLKDSRDNINTTADNRSIYQLVHPGWLVTNRMKAWQGSVGISPLRGIVSGHYICFAPLHDEDHRYLNWLFRSPRYAFGYGLISRGVRIGQAEIDNDHYRVLPVVVPPLDEQRRIAAYLDDQTVKIDELVSETERFIELSRERRAALITAAVTGQIDVRKAA